MEKGGRGSMETDKRAMRKRILRQRDGLSEEERKKGDILLTERILGHQWYYRSEYLLCYVSYGSEISTLAILQEALRAGKKVYVPKVLQDEEAQMAFFQIQSTKDLSEGYKGILEPMGNTQMYVYTEEKTERTLMLMPGVAFDSFRNRIGYGKGFYDRFLSDKALLRTIALGYRCQLLERLPASDKDIKPNQIICV